MGRHALGTDPGDVADRPVLLQAIPERAPPELGLVVVGAAGVEAHVAADRPHVAQLRARDEPRRVREPGKVPPHERIGRNVGERLERTDLEVGARWAQGDASHRGDAVQRDNMSGREQAVLHVRHQVRATRHGHGLLAEPGKKRDRVLDRVGTVIAEGMEPQHAFNGRPGPADGWSLGRRLRPRSRLRRPARPAEAAARP